MKEQLQQKIDLKTKPPGSLGVLETIALQVGCIQNTLTPVISQPHILVFAADHGIAAEGKVNPYPQAVTAQMVLNFVNGGAAINVFCRQHDIGLTIANAGVNFDFDVALPIKHVPVAKGTKDYSLGPAMNPSQVEQALQTGAELVAALHEAGSNCIGLGEMGIGNSSAAALILHHYTSHPMDRCAGKGTGVNTEQLQQKRMILEDVSRLHQLGDSSISAQELLCKIGGFEIAMMTGAYLEAHRKNILIVVDGFIATSALMVAHQINPIVTTHCIFAHCSDEQGHRYMLDYLEAQPLLQLGLRLGEGTGAALAMPLLQTAVAFLNEMASFESAGIEGKPI